MPAKQRAEGETNDTRILDMIFRLTFEISVGRQRILFLTRVRYKKNTITSTPSKHPFSFAFIHVSHILLHSKAMPISHDVYNSILPARKMCHLVYYSVQHIIPDLYGYKIQHITSNPCSFPIVAQLCVTVYTQNADSNFLKANIHSRRLMRQDRLHSGSH